MDAHTNDAQTADMSDSLYADSLYKFRQQVSINKLKTYRGGVLPFIYKFRHPGVKDEQIPYMWRRSILEQIWHTIRKWIYQVW